MTKRWISSDQLAQLPPRMTARALGGAAGAPAQNTRPRARAEQQLPPPVVSAPPAPALNATQRMQAKGRLPKGTMNKSETAYSEHLELLKQAGQVLWYKFEGIKLMLAPNTSITVDFAVMLACGTMEMHDVKGARAIVEDDARAKMKVAAAMYPFVFRMVFPIKSKDGGGWDIELVGR